MTDQKKITDINDAILFRTIESGCSADVLKLFKICDKSTASFSDDALNKSVIQACYKGHAVLIKFLLEDGARLEVRDDDGNTPLLISCRKGISEIVKFLLTRGADVNAANNNGDTGLFLSTSREVIQLFLGQKELDLNHRNKQGNTVLMSANGTYNLEKVKTLIECGFYRDKYHFKSLEKTSHELCDSVIDLSYKNKLDVTHRLGSGSMIEQFINTQPSHSIQFSLAYIKSVSTFANDAINWPVMKDCHMELDELITFLLEDERLKVRDTEGNTPLMIFSKEGMLDVVKFLLTNGADINAANKEGNTALILSTSKEVIQCLLSQSCVHLNHRNKLGKTALMAAVENVQLEKVKLLINSGACPNAPNTECLQQCSCLKNKVLDISGRDNALTLAKKKGIDGVVRLLYQSRLLASSPFLLAAKNCDFQTCNFLLQSNLCDNNEVLNIPNILCLVLTRIQQGGIVGDTEIELVRKICDTGVNVNECNTCHMSDSTTDTIERENVDKTNTSKKPPIKIALEIGHYELANILCAHGANVSHDDVILSVDKHHAPLIPLLIRYGADKNKKDNNGCIVYPQSALDVALASSNVECAKVLLNKGAHIDVKYAVKQSINKSSRITLDFLLNEYKEETEKVILNDSELMNIAAKNGDVDILQLLLEVGVDINALHNSKTPLMQAVRIEVLEFLLANGADVNVKSNTTALINLFSWNYREMLKKEFKENLNSEDIVDKCLERIVLFLKYKVKLDETDKDENTALTMCCITGSKTSILKMLLEKGSNANHSNLEGFTSLHYSAMNENWEEIKLLIQFGAKVNMESKDGTTPLHSSVDNVDVVQLLLENNANANAHNNEGDTALICAVENYLDLHKTVEVLIKYGADVNHRNNAGLSAVFIAAVNSHELSLMMLLDAHCDLNDVITSDHQPASVLSIVLNKWYLNDLSQNMALNLLKHGATSGHVRPDVIHRLILTGNDELIQKLILSGIGPSDILLHKKLYDWPYLSISPLIICLMVDHIKMARFFIETFYLTKSDITVLSRNKSIMDYVSKRSSETSQFLEKISSQPLRLELLCLISVSSILGTGLDRQNRVEKCLIPEVLKNCLMYNNLEIKYVESKGTTQLNAMKFLKMLTKCQIIEDDIEFMFYEQDDTFFEIDSDSEMENVLPSSDDSD